MTARDAMPEISGDEREWIEHKVLNHGWRREDAEEGIRMWRAFVERVTRPADTKLPEVAQL